LDASQVTDLTNNKINTHTFITKYLVQDLKSMSLDSGLKNAVINVGTLKDSLVE